MFTISNISIPPLPSLIPGNFILPPDLFPPPPDSPPIEPPPQDPPAQRSFTFLPPNGRIITATFDGEIISTDAGALLLAEVEELTHIQEKFAACFTDHRDPDLIEHSVPELIAQRVYAIALGYEDLNDHDQLRYDPLLATLIGKLDPTGQDRNRQQDQGKPLAGKSTLNRLELTPPDATAAARYKKIVARQEAIDQLFLEVFFESFAEPPAQLILDVDATADRIHGQQEGRFFHGYYRDYCYLPSYIFCGRHLLCARLHPADVDPGAAALPDVQRVIAAIRARWPNVRILLRGDGGFCREATMAWCERPGVGVDYLFGLGENARLLAEVADDLFRAHISYLQNGVPGRIFGEFRYQTEKSWSKERRVIYKAEYLPLGPNPRFVVTSLPGESDQSQVLPGEIYLPQALYEQIYCERGEMENRIKEQKKDLKSDRTSAATLRANQLRLSFASVAYLLLEGLRRLGLAETELASAQCGTIRTVLLKVAAVVKVTARTIRVSFSRIWPFRELLSEVWGRLQGRSVVVPPVGDG